MKFSLYDGLMDCRGRDGKDAWNLGKLEFDRWQWSWIDKNSSVELGPIRSLPSK